MAGNYVLAIANWDTTEDPSTGFTNPGTGSSFLDTGGNSRTGSYTVDISSSALTSTPEPSSVGLTLPASAGILLFLRHRRKRSQGY
jgi:hypothetical protein